MAIPNINIILSGAQVVMTEYVAGGGDGFKIIAENKEKHLQASPNQIQLKLIHLSYAMGLLTRIF